MPAKKLTKEQQQVVALVGVLVIIAGLLLWVFGKALLPVPTGTPDVPPPRAEIPIPQVNDKALYERPDFEQLHRFGSMPVEPTGPNGNKDPFAAAATGNR